jgi:hypothetical protein
LKTFFRDLMADERGNSLVELVMVMIMMILFGATIYTLIFAGSTTQRKIIDEKNAQTEARVAMSYVNVRLRQNDREGAVAVMPGEYGNALVIKGGGGEESLDRWILWSDGELREFIVGADEKPVNEPGMYATVAVVKGFDVRFNDGGVVSAVTYECNGKTREIVNRVYLRSGLDS